MKVKLEFNLPEERPEFDRANRADIYLIALEEFSNQLRSKYKHSDKQETTWDEVRDMFYEVLSTYRIDLFNE